MKKSSLVAISIFVLVISFIFINGCKVENNKNEYLRKVVNNLEKIESATYKSKVEGWAPGDTSAYGIFYNYVKEYNNPNDSTIGANFVVLQKEDTTKMTFCYDGKMRATVNEEDKAIVIDSFKIRMLPFRPVPPPFLNYAKNILRYALETKDSISIKSEDLKESLYFSLTIFENKQVEFFGKAHYMEDNPYNYGETTSKYEIWINKSNDLPFKVRREMSHDISVTTIEGVELSKLKIEDFNASDYFKPDYAIEAYRKGNQKEKKNILIGKVAPNWILKDVNDNVHSLNELKSKVVIIQFTSVSCGPCRASIPYLKELTSAYLKDKLDFVAIECTTKSLNALKQYHDKNTINYKFLMSTKEVRNDYGIKSFPVFFVLDKKRIIRKVITGYGKETTDKEIRDAIINLI